MDFAALMATVSSIKGATFASLDTVTFPTPGVKKVSTGVSVILFNSERGGYEGMVKRRLLECGRNPDNFVGGALPWGRRLYGPLIQDDKGISRYLQSIVLSPGNSSYFLRSIRGFDIPCNEADLPGALRRREPSGRRTNQGLPPDKEVIVRTVNVDHITSLRLMGVELQEQQQQVAV